jgi:hypothetical protein
MWNEIGSALSQSITGTLSRLAALFPGLVVLTVALLLAILVVKIVAALLRRSLARVDFDRRVTQGSFPMLAEWSSTRSPTVIVVRTVSCVILFAGLLLGIGAFDETLASEFISRLLDYLPNLLAAGLVLVLGTWIARFVARSVLIGAVNMNLEYASFLSAGVKWLMMVLVWAMALEHLGIGGDIIRLAFGILFGGIVLALALAVGLGSKELVSRSLDREAIRPPKESVREPVSHL